ncbi:MAG: hypothetical protein Q4A31_01845 [Corynebacterium sp.]|uniref:hypothetical protein n=1 Tax=Corynebacterium sp. TaxID=1720 RepID=UPI0026DC91EB|nr:hypothetical protein [Corynebacterium sp.]MDO4760648.1 hypothetical protein [Corynebacterium sp.]
MASTLVHDTHDILEGAPPRMHKWARALCFFINALPLTIIATTSDIGSKGALIDLLFSTALSIILTMSVYSSAYAWALLMGFAKQRHTVLWITALRMSAVFLSINLMVLPVVAEYSGFDLHWSAIVCSWIVGLMLILMQTRPFRRLAARFLYDPL